jgi:protocatechuate 3,4-dioxygenase beta subunit
MRRLAFCSLLIAGTLALLPSEGWTQGETTSAIVGQVTDATRAAVPGATVTIMSGETGLTRRGKTDPAGRFNFPQLKPGAYSVRVEAEGFEAQ